MAKTKILICSSEVGAGRRGASLGPDAIRISAVNLFYNIFDQLPSEEIKVRQVNRYRPEFKAAKYIKQIVDTHRKICEKMSDTLLDGYNVLVLSGDHSNSAGFMAGFREAYPEAKIGLIWIDAHGDIHSPYTSPSGNMHGMPVAIMLGLDNLQYQIRNLKPEVVKNWERLKRIGKSKITPKILPEDIVYIDIRDLEDEEWAILNSLNIKHYTPERIQELGVERVIKEVSAYFRKYDALYISFDADSLDPAVSIGTGTPVPGGLSPLIAEQLLTAFTELPNFRALELTEVNPLLDCQNKMATAVVKILRESFTIED
jgi:arginase